MKILYYTFQYLGSNNSGISKKIQAQVSSLKRLGNEVDFCCLGVQDNTICYLVNGNPVAKHGTGMYGKISTYLRYHELVEFILKQKYDLMYIRYTHNASPLYNKMLKEIHNAHIKILMEIPTFPYDGEHDKGVFMMVKNYFERRSRNNLYKYVYRIINYNNELEIFGIKTINISNAIDVDAIRVRSVKKHSGIGLLGVAVLDFWHGYDRLIRGLGDYYASNAINKEIIVFRIIGPGDNYISQYNDLAKRLGVEKHVQCLGAKSTDDMNDFFDISDCAIGSLGRHRMNIVRLKALKNVEYAMRGIPFIYSEENADFDIQPYVLKMPSDETPIDVKKLLQFIKQTKFSPSEIRNSVEHKLSWDKQMQIVMETIKKE